MTHAMTVEDAERVLRSPSMFTQPEVDAAHEVRLDAQREALGIVQDSDDISEAAPVAPSSPPLTEPEADLGLDAEPDRVPLIAWMPLFVVLGAAIWLHFLPGLAADLFGWVMNMARGFWMVALALAEAL